MAPPTSFRAIYKVLDQQEIDVDVYLPPAQDRETQYPTIIDIHGGAFMLGSSDLVNKDQVQDCLNRGWIVLVPNHRLCPQVNLLEGPMRDCRDLLAWIHDGGLAKAISGQTATPYAIDHDRIMAFGTSSGGTLALSLVRISHDTAENPCITGIVPRLQLGKPQNHGFDVPKPVAAIYDMYGPANFADPHWTTPLPQVAPSLSADLPESFFKPMWDESPVPIRGVVSLEGQNSTPTGAPDFNDPRQAFAFTQIKTGAVFETIFPSKEWAKVDPLLNVTADFPPTVIVHGNQDVMVPISLSKDFYAELQKKGVKCEFLEAEGEGHTFAAKMQVGSRTWETQRKGFDFLESVIRKE
ncbi:hypothetical protein jhhlp_007849 [Lomentospora prolificans]|uniref:Peptidase S9 prolyl oligopeptidase catalytic domain-containing protein n=1 Tax=Lomentospora prolificans TaxID=41688 RepID=A0A2N3N0R9_9PEZI|nr:hypothetical protein jhhlp_007849 [Lomentospora prolificans]